MFRKTAKISCMGIMLLALTAAGASSAAPFDADFTFWKKVLDQYVQNGFVDYRSLRENPDDLNQFLESAESVDRREYERWSRDQQIAFWINVYNALAVKRVIDHYPLKKGFSVQAVIFPENSIQQIPNVWNQKALQIFGQKTSLNMIENENLRKDFHEPRIHFALVCASIGCPVLRNEPYTGEQLNNQLNDQIRRFLINPGKFGYDSSTDTMHLSPIFKWFRKDFERAGGTAVFVKRNLPENAAKKISEKTKIVWLGYDWSLNERSSGNGS